MFLFEIFRSFLPIHNPIGFGAADFIELALALGLTTLALTWRPWVLPCITRVSRNPLASMVLLAVLPVILRLALVRTYPIPIPKVSDDYSYLLLADTFRHLRMTNPVHPLSHFFETFFVLQEPTYSSIFPIGQGILLAIFWAVFRSPWWGVACSVAASSALTYWMLRGWVARQWAFLGGLFAALMFGPLNQWMNSYWGGALSAIAGCLVFCALPRLKHGRAAGVLLGVGLAIQLLTRPFEFLFLATSAIVYVLVERRGALRQLTLATGCLLPAFALMLLHNQAVTGSWSTLPYELSRYQYGVPASFTFQPNPVPHRELTREQQLDYETQSQVHGPGTDTPMRFVSRLLSRVRFYRFFFLAPLYCALAVFLFTLKQPRSRWILFTVLLFAAGVNFYPYFYPHYVAALTSLLLLSVLIGFNESNRILGRMVVYVAAFHFVFWYGVHLIDIRPLENFETWVNIDRANPERRAEVQERLSQSPGKQLVFVRYGARHAFQEWVHNAADIDGQPIVWARDLGQPKNDKLRHYYSDRTAWLLETDNQPPTLSSYEDNSLPAMEQVP